MKKQTLTYNQLRQILALTMSNSKLKASIGDFLSGKLTDMTEVDLIDMIYQSEVDKEVIGILANRNADEMDAIEAMEYISDFFGYIRANKAKFNGWLASLGLNLTANEASTPLSALK